MTRNRAAQRESVPGDWSVVLQTHGRWLPTIVCARLQDPNAVDDVMQDVALTVLRQRTPLADATRLGPWLYRVAIRQVLQYYRTSGRHRRRCRPLADAHEEEVSDERSDPLEWMMAEETGRLLREMIARLPPQDREMLLLKHAHRWTYQQIADHLGLPFDTVVYRLARARLRARRLLAASQRDAVAL